LIKKKKNINKKYNREKYLNAQKEKLKEKKV
jgi:hypothetical protein